MTPLLTEGDAISRFVAWALLLMSVSSWVVMIWKTWLISALARDLPRSRAAFWQAPAMPEAIERMRALDRRGLFQPLLVAALEQPPERTMAAAGQARARLTRVLRDGLQAATERLQYGQVLLATVGSTAPFVGLLGTVWGIYHALSGMADSAQLTVDQVAGPVGEALVMTAAGLAVALPAVLAYNVLGRRIARLEAELEGFAHDLLELLLAEMPGQS
jgi:biopolymer transport protein ExbB